MSDGNQSASDGLSEPKPFPHVNGAWDMAIHWTRDGKVDVLVADAEIRQNGSEFSMIVRSDRSELAYYSCPAGLECSRRCRSLLHV